MTSAISDFIQFTESSGNTIVSVDANGPTGGHVWPQIATLTGVTGLVGHEAELFAANNIIAQ